MFSVIIGKLLGVFRLKKFRTSALNLKVGRQSLKTNIERCVGWAK